MRPPLWIINSVLLALLVLCVYAVLFLQPNTPHANSLLPKTMVSTTNSVTPVNLKSIYEDDLFKTHISGLDEQVVGEPGIQIPMPPAYQEPQSDAPDGPLFLEPLPITITGMMTFSNEAYNRVMIRDQRDQIERAYQVGDEIEDAQIVRILPNKVLIIRANSQQETLFLREQDVIADLDQIEPDWHNIISNPKKGLYRIKTREFTNYIKNLGNLVDLLNLITAYKSGISTGVKVGTNAVSPLVAQLGLQSGDIIVSINDIAVAHANGRVQVYQAATDPQTTILSVKILRDQKELLLEYILEKDLPQIVNNAEDVQAYVASNQAHFEVMNDKIKTQNRNHIAQFKNKISQSVSG